MAYSQKPTKDDIEKVKDLIAKAKKEKFTVLLVGRTGVGKSSTVNSLMGKKVAKVGAWKPTTMKVTRHKNEAYGVQFVFIDTPGLCDDLPEEGKDQIYLDRIKSDITEKVDCLWFISRLDDNRVSSDEMRAIKQITEAFGQRVWNNALIIFTYANYLHSSQEYRKAYNMRTRLIRQEIAKRTDPNSAAKVPSVAIDNTEKTTPDGKEWLGKLYVAVFTRMADHGFLPFFLATVERLQLPHQNVQPSPNVSPIKLDEEQAESMKQKVKKGFLELAAAGATAGAAIGAVFGHIGVVVGGVLGAIFGAVFGNRG